MRTYNPQPTDHYMFSNIAKLKQNKNYQGTVDRFKRPMFGSGLAPGKYGVIQEWHGKEEKKKKRHGL